jgi:hypothetical protein
VDARKQRFDHAAALELATKASLVICCRGKKAVEFRPGTDCEQSELLKAMMGPSGNLRAPAALVGSTLLIGWNQDAWQAALA